MRLLRWTRYAALAIALACSHVLAAPAQVSIVQPSGPEVAANLLRISIRFATQVEGPILPRLALLRAEGEPIEAPFLQQELWSPDGAVLTVLLHPGRVKTGLNARAENGPILSVGDEMTLTLDGSPIKRWEVIAARETGPIHSAWTISPVHVGSKERLKVTLDGPVDGLDVDYLAVADARDRRVAGHARLIAGETTWTFSPAAAWRAGAYKLVARGTLEDPEGNRLGGHFETAIESLPEHADDAVIPFVIGSSNR